MALHAFCVILTAILTLLAVLKPVACALQGLKLFLSNNKRLWDSSNGFSVCIFSARRTTQQHEKKNILRSTKMSYIKQNKNTVSRRSKTNDLGTGKAQQTSRDLRFVLHVCWDRVPVEKHTRAEPYCAGPGRKHALWCLTVCRCGAPLTIPQPSPYASPPPPTHHHHHHRHISAEVSTQGSARLMRVFFFLLRVAQLMASQP